MEKGMVVKSRAGRDKGGWGVILDADAQFALIADGKSRPLKRPKRKRKKHLAITNIRLDAAQMATDRELRRALRTCDSCLEKEVCDLGEG
jgi:ribosomal protein L14E/L6E/L27E